jgi:hypothetical protein
MRLLLCRLCAVAILALSGVVVAPSLAAAVELNLYRDVGRTQQQPQSQANLAPEQFNYNDELSLMVAGANPPYPKYCKYEFTVTLADADATQGPVQGLGDGTNYIATQDQNNANHWLVAPPDGTSTAAAGQATSAYALANRDNVVNGTANNCY